MSDNHYDVISNFSGFTCANSSHHKAKEKQCKACKSATKCDVSQQTSQCSTCYKFFYGKTCFDNHIKNEKCITHSYKCEKCDRFYRTADLKKADHKCDYVKCSNCKQYVPMNHECFMLKKDLKPASEKYIFYDFETTLDSTTNKHIVNYCVAQDFSGEERVFTTLDDFCKWVFNKATHKGYTFIAHYAKGYDA